MKFEAIRRRVERSEQLVEGRALQTVGRAKALKTCWREGWTPARIILAGLAAGFLVGRTDPAHALKHLTGGGRWLHLLGTLSGLFASFQASLAAASAGQASDDAAPQDPDDHEPRPRPDRRRPDPVWSTPPRPAEASTEVSER